MDLLNDFVNQCASDCVNAVEGETGGLEDLLDNTGESKCSCCGARGKAPCGCYLVYVHHESPSEIPWTEVHCSTHRKGIKLGPGRVI